GFPAAFAAITTDLHVPIVALLMAIVLRGAAFAFRSATDDRPREGAGWGAAFAVASLAAPLLLGMIVGALVSGHAPEAPRQLGLRGPWLSPFAFAAGLFALALFAFLAAVYLTVDAVGDAELQED